MYIDGNPVLHVIDEATRYQAAKWLHDLSAKHTWETLRYCWMDTYVGPPDHITHDAGKNFVSKEFRQLATSLGVATKSVLVEAHWSIGMVERAHPVLQRAYQIIADELKGETVSKHILLQMAVKAVNDTMGPDGLVPTLLVYGAYPRMSNLDPLTPSMTQRAKAIQRAMEEIAKIRAKQQVNTALNHRNGPSVTPIHETAINSLVLVWREGQTGRSGSWTGPFKLLGIDKETCYVELPSGSTDFRSTAVKPFYQPKPEQDDPDIDPDADPNVKPDNQDQDVENPEESSDLPDPPRRNPDRGRQPPGRFRQNVADVTVYLGGCTEKGAENP